MNKQVDNIEKKALTTSRVTSEDFVSFEVYRLGLYFELVIELNFAF